MRTILNRFRGRGKFLTLMSMIGVLLLSAFAMTITGIFGNFVIDEKSSSPAVETSAAKLTSFDYTFSAYGCYIGSSYDAACTKSQYESYTTFATE